MSGLTSKISLLLYAIAVALAALVADGAIRLASATRAVPRNRELFAKIYGPARTDAGTVTAEDYAAIQPDLFCAREARPPAPVEPRRYIPTSGRRSAFVLRGTLIHTNPALSRAFIEIPGMSEQQAYRLGDTVGGAEIIAIEDDTAELRRGDEIITIQVSFGEQSPQSFLTPAGAASSSAAPMDPAALQEAMRRLPRSIQEVLQRVEPQERNRILQLEPSERMRALRDLMRAQRSSSSRDSRRRDYRSRQYPRRDR
jgi:hypothetical protein